MAFKTFRDMRANTSEDKVMEVKRIGQNYALVMDEDTAEMIGLYDGQILPAVGSGMIMKAGKALKDAVKKG